MPTYDAFSRVDHRLIRRFSFLSLSYCAKKIMSAVVNATTMTQGPMFVRNSIKDGLASLDPLLRDVVGWGAPS
jgi:hypothetical protein